MIPDALAAQFTCHSACWTGRRLHQLPARASTGARVAGMIERFVVPTGQQAWRRPRAARSKPQKSLVRARGDASRRLAPAEET
jgi:hypothetical protein